MNLLLDFWNSRLSERLDRLTDCRSEPLCRTGMCPRCFLGQLSERRTEDQSIILISHGVGSVASSSAFCPGLTDVWTAICHARRVKNPRGICFKNIIHAAVNINSAAGQR